MLQEQRRHWAGETRSRNTIFLIKSRHTRKEGQGKDIILNSWSTWISPLPPYIFLALLMVSGAQLLKILILFGCSVVLDIMSGTGKALGSLKIFLQSHIRFLLLSMYSQSPSPVFSTPATSLAPTHFLLYIIVLVPLAWTPR